MAAFETTRPSYGSSPAISTLISRILGRLTDWNDARITRKSLSALTDRELEDIGLARGDIDAVTQGSFFR